MERGYRETMHESWAMSRKGSRSWRKDRRSWDSEEWKIDTELEIENMYEYIYEDKKGDREKYARDVKDK